VKAETSNSRRWRHLSRLFLAAVVTALVALSWERRVVEESFAARDAARWDRAWRSGSDPEPILLGRDLLPSQLPGPLDRWAGGRAHRLTVRFQGPPGRYLLELRFLDVHPLAPPVLRIETEGGESKRLSLPAGRGLESPGTLANPTLTRRVPLLLDSEETDILLTSSEGSWCKFSSLRLTRGWRFNPARSAYLLLTSRPLQVAVALLLAAAVWCLGRARGGKKPAYALLALAGLSSIFSILLAELATRAILVRRPEQRALRVENLQSRRLEQAGMHYVYSTMVVPDPDPEILYRLKPGLNGFFAGHPLRTNRHGLRGPDADEAKSAGVFRVAGLGDSVMFGWGVSYEETALTRAGRLLGDRLGRPVETLNFGCPSYNTRTEVALYRRAARRFRPDAVVLVFMENDLGFPGLMLEPIRLFALRRSYLLEQLRRRLASHWRDAAFEEENLISARRFEERPETVDPARARWLESVRRRYQEMTGIENAVRDLGELGALLGEDGVAGVVVYNPIRLTVGDPGTREPQIGAVLAAARAAGMAAVDMSDAYESYLRERGLARMEDGLWLSAEDWHPNADGHALMAEAIAAALDVRAPQPQ